MRLAAALALIMCAGLADARAQEVEDITGAIEKYRTILVLANQKLDDLELAEAMAAFTEVIDGYKAGRLPAGTPLTRQIVGQAYEGRARTHANLGKASEAEADFEALIRFDVSWPVDRTRTSPKIVALYDKVRKRIVGALAIRTDPAGAVVTLNGEAIGRGPIFDRELTSGRYTVQIQAEGFDPLTETITLEGGGRLEKTFKLIPNARSILVVTSPAGARILIDNLEKGTTFGAAGPEYAAWAARMEIAAADISSPLLVEHLPPGSHMLKIEKACFEPQLLSISLTVDPNDNSPVPFEPIRLSPSLGSLSLDSTPAGAEALVDGKPAGRTPLNLDGLCSGKHDVILRVAGLGQWIGSVEVPRGQRTSLNQRPRMTLAYVGMTAPGPGGSAPPGEAEIGEALSTLGGYNVLRPGAGLPDELLARKQTVASGELSDEYLDSVAARTGADLILAARPGEGGFEKRCEVLLYPSRRSLRPLRDRLSITLSDKEPTPDLKGILEKLQAAPVLSLPWIGMSTVDLYRSTNPVVVRVSPKGPAAAAGVKAGDAVNSLGGKAIDSSRGLENAVSAMKEGTQASLTLQRPGSAPRQVNVMIGSTPVVLPYLDRDDLSSRAAAELHFRGSMEAALGRPAGAERTAALLSLGLLLMRVGLYNAAIDDALLKVSAPEGPGLSAGTIAYLKGIAYWRINKLVEARQQLTYATTQPDATMWSNGGPPVAERARRALSVIPPS
ncbi:MAG TPA: PEGA domain-containing protein [Candidatus Polarisedimenticolia bacterium]